MFKKLFLMFSIVFSFVTCKEIYASNIFYDNFLENTELTRWTEYPDNLGDTGNWLLNSDGLHSYADTGTYSFLCKKESNLPMNYVFESDVINVNGVDQDFIFRVSDDLQDYYLVNYRYNDPDWSWDNNNVRVFRIKRDGYVWLGDYSGATIGQGTEHKLKIELRDQYIDVYFDNVLIISAKDNSQDWLKNSRFCLRTWGGNIPGVSENIYKYVRFSNNDQNNKIILIPGLGASWNAEAMLIGSTTLDSGWKMTPFVKNYDKLVDTFEDKGLVRDQDFFVWNYDWRKPLSEIVTDFNNFIYGLNLGENDKLYLVGHSLGGMVARIWSQDNPLKVEKVISLGSPHYGSVKAYEAWNGVKVSDSVDFSSIALNIFLRLKSSNGENSVKVLREFAPIVLDLNPTFSFLRKNGQDLKSTSFSYYLELQNQNIAPILGKLKTVDGVGEETKSILNLGERSLFDKVLQIWEQGRPISSVNDVGDGTVLKKSALIGGTSGSEYQSKHGDLVDKSVDYIMNEFNLGVSPTSSMMRAFSLENEHNLLVFYSDINGTLQVNCSGIEKSAVDGFVWFENVDSNSCRVKMLASETGKYRLLAEGEKTIDLNLDLQKDQEREISLSGGDGYWLALEEYSSILGANNMAIGVANRDISMTIDEYIRFRQVNKNIKYGEEILTGMRYILSQKSYSQIETNTAINNAAKSKSLVESNLRLFSRSGKTPSIYAASTYDLAENMVKFKDYSGAILADKLYKIVWK
ncbi:MAG: alpha/beta fold hydrolase [Candidatus Shapirobacteria bacterium]